MSSYYKLFTNLNGCQAIVNLRKVTSSPMGWKEQTHLKKSTYVIGAIICFFPE